MVDKSASEVEPSTSSFGLKFFLIGGIILVFVLIIVVIGMNFSKQTTESSEISFDDVDANGNGLVDSGEASTVSGLDFSSADTNGDESLTEIEFNTALRRRGGGGSSETNNVATVDEPSPPSGITGFFAKFFTGNVASTTRDGTPIGYDDGWVGIGTGSPDGTFTIKSFQDGDPALAGRQGKITFYTDTSDIAYDGGDDGKYFFTNTKGNGITAFTGNSFFGIGTQAPTHLLEVSGATDHLLSLVSTGTGATSPNDMHAGLELRSTFPQSIQFIDFVPGSTGSNTPDYGGRIVYSGIDHSLAFVTGGENGDHSSDMYIGNEAVAIGKNAVPFTDGSGAAKLTIYDVGLSKITISGGSSNAGGPAMPILQLRDQATLGKTWNIENGRDSGDGVLGFYLEGSGTKFSITSSGDVKIASLVGTGDRFACVHNDGTLYASPTACAA